MITPLMSPAPTPTARAQMTMTTQPYDWVASVVAHTDASPTTDPTDRSMPPVVMTNVMPMARTPRIDPRLRMVMRLLTLANRSPPVTKPTTHRSSRATTSPTLRPAAPDRNPPLRRSLAAFSTRADSSASGFFVGTDADTLCSLTRHFLP